MNKDYILQIKVRNGPLLRAMRNKGYRNVAAFSRATGISPSDVGRYLGLKEPALNRKGEWRTSVLKLAAVLGTLPGDLFPPQHWTEALPKDAGRAEVEVSLDEVQQIGGGSSGMDTTLLEYNGTRLPEVVTQALLTLTPREEQVIRAQFGINREEETLSAIAERWGCSRSRVAQVFEKGMRKLRHPTRSRTMREAMDWPPPARHYDRHEPVISSLPGDEHHRRTICAICGESTIYTGNSYKLLWYMWLIDRAIPAGSRLHERCMIAQGMDPALIEEMKAA